MSYSPRTVAAMNSIAHKYQGLIQAAVTKVLNEPRYKNTGFGVASVTVEVTDGDASKSPVIRIEFDDRLLFMDKSKMQWTRLPNMKGLLEWAATKESSPTKIKQLAWRTAKSQLKFDRWKPKKWRKKSLSEVLKEMNEMVLKEFDEAIEGDLKESAVGSRQ